MGKSSKEFWGEVLGTFILVFFGLGSVAVEIVTSVTLGLPVIALIWGAAVAVAIRITGPISGAHLNPSITVAFACWARFSWRKVPLYLGAQFVGAILAAAAVYGLFAGAIAEYELAQGVVRGEPGSEATAMIFGEYFPNPGGKPLVQEIPMWKAAWVEFWGTVILAMMVFGVVAWAKEGLPGVLLPILIGLGLAGLIYFIAPVSQAGFNAARDLGPRTFSALAGWGTVPFTTNGMGWLWVYVVSPFAGGVVGGGLWKVMVKLYPK